MRQQLETLLRDLGTLLGRSEIVEEDLGKLVFLLKDLKRDYAEKDFKMILELSEHGVLSSICFQKGNTTLIDLSITGSSCKGTCSQKVYEKLCTNHRGKLLQLFSLGDFALEPFIDQLIDIMRCTACNLPKEIAGRCVINKTKLAELIGECFPKNDIYLNIIAVSYTHLTLPTTERV